MKVQAAKLRGLAAALVVACGGAAGAQAVKDLPMPTSYVNDFAHVLSAETTAQIEAECVALHKQANADVALVTLSELKDDQTIEEFTSELEDKWKLGKKGSDRSAIFVIVMNPHKLRIETGYGLEAVLPDAMDGRIRDKVAPYAHAGDFNDAAKTGINEMAAAIAADAHVTLEPAPIDQVHEAETTTPSSAPGLSGCGVLIPFFFILMLVVVLALVFGRRGGRGGGGWSSGSGFGGSDDSGSSFGGGGSSDSGGFDGSDGGSSGGGGASGDY